MPQERLFTGDGVTSIRDLAIRGVRPRVEAFTEGQLQGNSPDTLAQDVADYVMGQTVELYTEEHRMSTSIVPVSELDAPVPAAPDGAQPRIEVVQASLYIPYTGTTRIFRTQPSRALSTPTPEATLTDRQVILSVIAVPGDDGTDAQERLLRLERNLEQWVSVVNGDVEALKADLKIAARDLIAQRIAVRRQRDDMESALTIPLLQLEAGRALQIPLQRKRITPQKTPATEAGEPPEWTITDLVYEEMIRTIRGFTHALGRRPIRIPCRNQGEDNLIHRRDQPSNRRLGSKPLLSTRTDFQ